MQLKKTWFCPQYCSEEDVNCLSLLLAWEFIAASTFHKLGLNIISQVNSVMPRITQISLRKFVKEQLILNMQSDAYLNLLSSYLLYNRVVAKSEFEFKSQKEYDEYLKLNPPTTVNNETVKSYGEMDIANFLMQNGIQYIYEQPYEIDTRTSEYGQYYPDFYLPDYKIYIEYFGIVKYTQKYIKLTKMNLKVYN